MRVCVCVCPCVCVCVCVCVNMCVCTGPNSTQAAAINSAVEGLGRALARDLAPIRVNVVSPGAIDTPLWNKVRLGLTYAHMGTVSKRAEPIQARAGTLPRPQHVA